MGRITKAGRIDLRSAMVTSAHRAKRFHPFWKREYRDLTARIGKQKAVVAVARRLLVSIWHILKKREVDQYGSEQMIARAFMDFAYQDLGAANLPDGLTAPEFVRRNLDVLGIGKDLQKIRRGKHTYLLPPSALPGAAPAAEPTGHGQRQNTKAAKQKRAARGAAKRAELAARRAEAEARMGRPRKTRSDKGVKRGPYNK